MRWKLLGLNRVMIFFPFFISACGCCWIAFLIELNAMIKWPLKLKSTICFKWTDVSRHWWRARTHKRVNTSTPRPMKNTPARVCGWCCGPGTQIHTPQTAQWMACVQFLLFFPFCLYVSLAHKCARAVQIVAGIVTATAQRNNKWTIEKYLLHKQLIFIHKQMLIL